MQVDYMYVSEYKRWCRGFVVLFDGIAKTNNWHHNLYLFGVSEKLLSGIEM